MKVFLTGATGYVGSHILRALLLAGHHVIALSRRPQYAQPHLQWIKGELSELGNYSRQWEDSDAIVHTAMEYQQGEECSSADLAALALFMRTRAFVLYTGNLFTCPNNGYEIEEHEFTGTTANWRNGAESLLLTGADNAAIVRLGFVYGGRGSHLWSLLPVDPKGHHLMPRQQGIWPMVHIDDVVQLYMRVLAQRATGIFHAVSANTPSREVVEAVATLTGAGTTMPLENDGGLLSASVQASSRRARVTGWTPCHTDFKTSIGHAFVQHQEHDA